MYHSNKYLSPIAIISILWLYRDKIRKERKWKWGVFLLAMAVVVAINIQPFSNLRAEGVLSAESGFRLIKKTAAKYFNYFLPRTLSQGDRIERHNIFGVVNLWWWEIGLMWMGIMAVISKWMKKRQWSRPVWLLMVMLLIAPMPAALTLDPFHAIRSVIMMIPIVVMVGIGAGVVWSSILGRWKKIVAIGFLGLIAWEVGLLGERIVVQDTISDYRAWNGGYKQLVEYVKDNDWSQYDHVFIDTTDEPAVYSLWQIYGQVETKDKIPLEGGYYKASNKQEWTGPESLVLKGGNVVEFRNIYWPKDQKIESSVFAGSKWRFDRDALRKAGAKVLYEITDLRGEVMWMVVATR